MEQRPNAKPMSFSDFKRMIMSGMKDGGIMNAKRGLVDEPGGYAGEMPSIKEIWSKEGEDDPLGTIVKLGLKTGGTLYFSFELGYGFGTIPDSLTFNAVSSTGISESVTEDIPNIPGIGSGGMVVGNIGFGISF